MKSLYIKILSVLSLILFISGYVYSNDWSQLILSSGVNNSGNSGSQIVSLPDGDIVVAGHFKSDEVQLGDIVLKGITSAAKLVSLDKKKSFIARMSGDKFI